MTAIYDLISPMTYEGKMHHPLPQAPVISREQFLISAAAGRCVVDIGASGPMSIALAKVAGEYHSINISAAEYCIDLDKADALPGIPGLDVVIAGEVIEHLSNAGHFLDLLRAYGCPVVLTTPNAFSAAGRQYILQGIECVNPEHVCWYSYHTLRTLVERHGYRLISWAWYNGNPGIAEGMIFVIEVRNA